MSPRLATIIFILFILYLNWTDRRRKSSEVSLAVWVPLLWMLFAVRSLAAWLNPETSVMTVEAYLEGDPLNRVSYSLLILVGAIILSRRQLNWLMLIRNNIWILLYFLFSLASISWSDYSNISLKRLVKASGNVIMALIVLTEQRPDKALGVIIRRFAFLLLPLSILFIRYYPDLGRTYHVTGTQMFTGVASQKNGLGQLCLISGIYFAWDLLINTRKVIGQQRRSSVLIYFAVISMIVWLLYMADSATSFFCIVLAIFLFLIGTTHAMIENPQRIFTFGLAIIGIFMFSELAFQVSNLIIVNILNRDPSLTTRVPMWRGLIAMAKRPIIGVGYESFWLGSRLGILWEAYGRFNQSHNGYLETYLNLGIIGLIFLVVGILSGLFKMLSQLKKEYAFALLRIAFIFIVAIYNLTEASLHGVNNMLLLLFVGILDMSGKREHVEIDNGTPFPQNLSSPASKS